MSAGIGEGKGIAALVLGVVLLGTGCDLSPRPPTATIVSPVRFSERDRVVIKNYFGNFEYSPGLSNPSTLAPTLEKRLEMSATVPPGLAALPLPLQLERRLSALPPGYERFQAGSDVVLMDIRTREVQDVVHDVLSPTSP